MFKSLGKVVVVSLVIIGAINFHALNKPAFSSISKTVTTKSLGKIPGEVIGTITSHQWRVTR